MKRWLVLSLAFAFCAGCANVEEKVPEPFGTRPAGAVLRDGLIMAAVKAKLTAGDPDSATSLGVSVKDGDVTLTGTVRDAGHKRFDVAEASRVAGVRSISDQLRVDPSGPRPGQQLSEAAIATRIVAAYTAEVGFQRVEVHFDRGVATLTGPVADAKTRATIAAAAHSVKGVRFVVNRMVVTRK